MSETELLSTYLFELWYKQSIDGCLTIFNGMMTVLIDRAKQLESENKALRLIAGSHSMSELRRNRIMGDKWFKYPEAPRGEE